MKAFWGKTTYQPRQNGKKLEKKENSDLKINQGSSFWKTKFGESIKVKSKKKKEKISSKRDLRRDYEDTRSIKEDRISSPINKDPRAVKKEKEKISSLN